MFRVRILAVSVHPGELPSFPVPLGRMIDLMVRSEMCGMQVNLSTAITDSS